MAEEQEGAQLEEGGGSSTSPDEGQTSQDDDRTSQTEASKTDYVSGLKDLFQAGSGICHDLLRLFAVELQIAGRSLAAMFMLALVLVVLVICIWLLLNGLLAIWLVQAGILSLVQALWLFVLANILLAGITVLAILRLSRNLTFQGFIRAVESILPSGKEEGS